MDKMNNDLIKRATDMVAEVRDFTSGTKFYFRKDMLLDIIIELCKELENARKSDNILNALYAAGVNNWEGYEFAVGE